MGRHGRRGDGRDPRGEVPDGLGGLLPGGEPGVREVEVVSRSTAGRLRSRGLPGLLRRPGIGRSPSGHRRPLTTRTPTPCCWSRDRRCFVPLPTPFHSIQRSAWARAIPPTTPAHAACSRPSKRLWRRQPRFDPGTHNRRVLGRRMIMPQPGGDDQVSKCIRWRNNHCR